MTIIVRAPVRISFGGGGTDLAAYYERFGGFVLSAAITRYAYVIAEGSPNRGIRINSADYHLWQTFERGTIPAVEEPLALPKAAVEWFAERGLREAGVDLFLASEVPPGTGLGSSSAMAVALTRALAAHLGLDLSASAVAEIACLLEIERLAMPIGKQDQYASAFGGINAVTFNTSGVDVERLDLPPDVTSTLSSRLLLFSTGRSRNSSTILRQQREDTGNNQAVARSLHRLKELAHEMRTSLLEQDLDRFGRLLDAGWQQKRALSARVSSPDIDRYYDAARRAGALGGKITGAGGGGFFLLYVPVEHQERVRSTLTDSGLREMSFEFDFGGARLLKGTSGDEPWISMVSHVLIQPDHSVMPWGIGERSTGVPCAEGSS